MNITIKERPTFPHRTFPHHDLLLQSFERRFGNDGYAFYFKMQELLFRTVQREIQLDDYSYTLLADMVGVEESEFHELLNHALKQGFFEEKTFQKRNVLTSFAFKQAIFYQPDPTRRVENPKDNVTALKMEEGRQKFIETEQEKQKLMEQFQHIRLKHMPKFSFQPLKQRFTDSWIAIRSKVPFKKQAMTDSAMPLTHTTRYQDKPSVITKAKSFFFGDDEEQE